MQLNGVIASEPDPEAVAFYRHSLETLNSSSIPFLVGGAAALEVTASIRRWTKDLDIFVLPGDCRGILDFFARAGYTTELTFPHWLGKAYRGDNFFDVIFGSGNGLCRVDPEWFEHSEPASVFGVPVRLCPVEETIWSKSFIMERERYDGGDIAHLLRSRLDRLDWERLLKRFDVHWPVLLSHLLLFRYIYPGERDRLPPGVMQILLNRAAAVPETLSAGARLCRGTLLSRSSYLQDVRDWGYRDARLAPEGAMSQADIDRWTAPAEKG